MASLTTFLTGLAIITAIALVVTAATAGRWSLHWIARNHRARTAQHTSVRRYYGQLALSH